MLGEIPRWRCTQLDWLLSLWEIQSCLSMFTDSFLFRERLHSPRPPLFFLPGTCEKKAAGKRIWAAGDKRAHAGSMAVYLAINAGRAFTCPLHSARSASLRGCKWHDLVRCEWQWTGWQPFSGGFRRGGVIGLCDWPRPLAVICFTQWQIMTKAVNELRLEWSTPEEPSHSRLDECFLPGRHQALRQHSFPFFPEVHNELTELWCASYLSRIHPSALVALTFVDGAEEKWYEHLLPLDESVAAHLCPPTAIGWKARASHPSKPCRAISALTGHAYSVAG